MRPGLLIIRINNFKHYSVHRQLRFAIVNLEKPGNYPSNFVCMLPLHIYRSIGDSLFARTFGGQCSDLAKELLTDALKKERDPDIKAEIERRLELIVPRKSRHITCSGCGRLFQPKNAKRYRRNLCAECLSKKFEK